MGKGTSFVQLSPVGTFFNRPFGGLIEYELRDIGFSKYSLPSKHALYHDSLVVLYGLFDAFSNIFCTARSGISLATGRGGPSERVAQRQAFIVSYPFNIFYNPTIRLHLIPERRGFSRIGDMEVNSRLPSVYISFADIQIGSQLLARVAAKLPTLPQSSQCDDACEAHKEKIRPVAEYWREWVLVNYGLLWLIAWWLLVFGGFCCLVGLDPIEHRRWVLGFGCVSLAISTVLLILPMVVG